MNSHFRLLASSLIVLIGLAAGIAEPAPAAARSKCDYYIVLNFHNGIRVFSRPIHDPECTGSSKVDAENRMILAADAAGIDIAKMSRSLSGVRYPGQVTVMQQLERSIADARRQDLTVIVLHLAPPAGGRDDGPMSSITATECGELNRRLAAAGSTARAAC